MNLTALPRKEFTIMRHISTNCLVLLLSIAGQAAQQDFSVPSGLSSLVCRVRQGGNTLRELLPNVPEGTLVYTFDATTQAWSVNQFQFGAWTHPMNTLLPGNGAYIHNPGKAFPVTLIGDAPSSLAFPTLVGRLNLVSLPGLEQSELPARPGDRIFWPELGTAFFSSCAYDDLDQKWLPALPPADVLAGAFFYERTSFVGKRCIGGVLYMNNYVPAAGIDALMKEATFGCGLAGTNYSLQLYRLDADGQRTEVIGTPVPFLGGLGAGYLEPVAFGDSCTLGSKELEVESVLQFRPDQSTSVIELGAQRLSFGPVQSSPQFPLTLSGLEPMLLETPGTPLLGVSPVPSRTIAVVGDTVKLGLPPGWAQNLFPCLDSGTFSGYRWQRRSSGSDWTEVAGAAGETLVLLEVTKDAEGQYRVLVKYGTNEYPTAPSRVQVVNPLQLRAERGEDLTGAVTVSVTTEVGFDYSIEASPDLVRWSVVKSFPGVGGWAEIPGLYSPDDGSRYFRAQLIGR